MGTKLETLVINKKIWNKESSNVLFILCKLVLLVLFVLDVEFMPQKVSQTLYCLPGHPYLLDCYEDVLNIQCLMSHMYSEQWITNYNALDSSLFMKLSSTFQRLTFYCFIKTLS